MSKGTPYLLAGLVALTLSAGWAAPVLALLEHATDCLGGGGTLDLLRLRCTPAPPQVLAWPFWATLVGVGVVVMGVTHRRGPHRG
jgi:hypothetical protein